MMLRGAEVFTVDLPAVEGVNGIDDLLAAWGPDRVLALLSSPVPAKPPDHASTKEIADAICRNNHFAQDAGGKLYRYVEGVYRSDGSQQVRRLVKDLLECWKLSGRWSSHRAEEVVEYIRVDAPLLWEKPPVNVINVLNGLLRVEWGAMRDLQPHTPEHLSAVQLPVCYSPAATCPNTEKFVKDVFPDDAREVPWELFALLMTPGPSFQKAVLLIGSGGNGKSTFLAQLIAFIGKKNVSNVSLHKLEADKFAGARLIGKLANICPDLPSEHLSGTSVFKAITGGDPISAEYKFKDGFDFVPFCRLVFSANTPPKSQDSSEGFFDRWLVIPFNRAFRGTGEEIPRSQLDAMLADPRELSGVLNKALDAFPTVSVKGITETASMREAWSEFRMVTDHLAVWLERATVEYPHACTRKNALRIAYNAARDGDGLANMTASAFGRALKKLRPNMQEAQRTFAGKVEWVYLGIGLKTPQDLHPVQEMSNEFSSDDSRGSRDSRDLPFFNLSREEDR
jgi:putative DNA primase/helicase